MALYLMVLTNRNIDEFCAFSSSFAFYYLGAT
jgi:hypothetical protein